MEKENPEEARPVRELQEERSQLLSLKAHAGFKYYQEILDAQQKTRVQAIVLTPLDSLDKVPHQEYSKGEAAGILLALDIVDARLTDLNEQIDELLKPKEGNNEDENREPIL